MIIIKRKSLKRMTIIQKTKTKTNTPIMVQFIQMMITQHPVNPVAVQLDQNME